MPRVGPIFSLDPGYLAVLGDVIQPSQHNPVLEDIGQALTDSLPRNGTGPMTGNLAMGGFKITGMAAATVAGDALRYEQIGAFQLSTSALSLAANEMVYANGVNTAAKTSLTAFARTLLDDPDAATALATLGAQPLDSDLTAVAGLASTGLVSRTGAGTMATRSITSSGGSVTITNPAGVAGDINLEVASSGSVLLGTIATTSGTSVTLSSLVLTSYKFLKIFFEGVSTDNASSVLSIDGDSFGPALGATSARFYGTLDLNLETGTWASVTAPAASGASTTAAPSGGSSSYTTATTSISFSVSPGNFDLGSIKVYGVR